MRKGLEFGNLPYLEAVRSWRCSKAYASAKGGVSSCRVAIHHDALRRLCAMHSIAAEIHNCPNMVVNLGPC